jgi:ribonuclease BN (tRNA processing enzyme)
VKIRVLGCSGGISGAGHRTTSLIVDDDTLVDCGTGTGSLELPELLSIDRVFVTHSHLDHVALLPMLVDTVGDRRTQPITVYALDETVRILRSHIFNWLVWPDFSTIPNATNPFLQFQSVKVGDVIDIGRGRTVSVLPAHHSVPAVGYSLESAGGSLAFTGDTALSDLLVDAINRIRNLRYLLVETAFPNSQQDLALAARHLCPVTLHKLLDRLNTSPEVFVTHLKPTFEAVTAKEAFAYDGRLQIDILEQGHEFELKTLQ